MESTNEETVKENTRMFPCSILRWSNLIKNRKERRKKFVATKMCALFELLAKSIPMVFIRFVNVLLRSNTFARQRARENSCIKSV